MTKFLRFRINHLECATMFRKFAIFALIFASCSRDSAIPSAWLSVPEAPRFRSLALKDNGEVTHRAGPTPRAASDGPIHLAGGRIMNGEKALTEAFLAIDSFDYSEARGEVVFSVKRGTNFDIGLVSSDGSPISWVPNDPADELGVQWAPRGSKISYVIRTAGGDVVRTLHVPTSASLPVEFVNGTIRELAWDPAAERYAVTWSTPDASERVEVMKYSGAERRSAIPPKITLDVEVEPFAPGAIVLRPRDLRYEEKLPVVVWRATDFAWSDARAALMQNARVAVVVTTRAISDELWKNVDTTAWMDAQRTFVAGAEATRPQAISIVADELVPSGRYRRANGTVYVPAAVVQSFAAGFIADQLKRTSPTNGSSR